ncbi:GumC family protein [Rhizobium sp. CFBP 13726]|uniref:GumC family protein n=1 Tax=Rhizobium sp. CFBP 13726 TaxID=2775296 RepID=UPI0017819E1F|nr:GumC family protein [Rhizobium sp. CFBP 13726]MBD8653843.1 GumC family protein [Rhizobium sp. CFBP 13726]
MSAWDMSDQSERLPNAALARRRSHDMISRNRESDALFDIARILGFLAGKGVLIAVVAMVIAALLLTTVLLVSFPYTATAVVFVDPRDQNVTMQQEVLPAIGTDAAVLESMVQIVRSDGFLIDLIQKLHLLEDGQPWTGSEDQIKQLAKLRKKIDIERMGATYLVKISYHAANGNDAARIANEIAAAFAANQNGLRSSANVNASRALTDRLVELRSKLNAAEEAVAQFKADNNIVYIDERNTVQMRQLSDLSQQLATVKSASEEAGARYAEFLANGTFTRSATQGNDENEQLSFLRRQWTQLIQARDQQIFTYGPRHPRLVDTQQMLNGLERQITQQRTRLAEQIKSERDINLVKQEQLARQVDDLSSNISQTEDQRVQLTSLEREANANRELYQQLLSRNKATNELVQQPTDNVRVVSPAVVPILSSRPPIVLLVPVIGFISLVLAIVLVALASFRPLKPALRRQNSTSYSENPPENAVEPGQSSDRKYRSEQWSLLSLLPDNRAH